MVGLRYFKLYFLQENLVSFTSFDLFNHRQKWTMNRRFQFQVEKNDIELSEHKTERHWIFDKFVTRASNSDMPN